MKSSLLITLFLSLFTYVSLAQNNLDALIESGKSKYNSGEYEASLVDLKEALHNINPNSDFEKRIAILKCINGSYYQLGKYDSAAYYTIQSIETAKLLKNDTLLGDAYYNQGLNYKKLSDFGKTSYYYGQALKIFERTNSIQDLSKVYNSFANLERQIGNLDLSIEYHLKAIEIRSSINDAYEISKSYHNIGQTYNDSGLYDMARFYLFKAVRLKEYSNKSTSASYSQIGVSYMREDNFDSAKYYLSESLALRKEESNKSKIATSFNYLGELYLEHKYYDSSESFLDSAYNTGIETNNKGELIEIVRNQINLAKSKGDYFLAAEKYDELLALQAATSAESNNRYISLLNFEFNTAEDKKTIENQTTQIKIQQTKNELLQYRNLFLTLGLIAIFLVTFIIIYFLLKLRKSKKETEEKNDELQKSNTLIENLHNELSHRTKNYYTMFRSIFKHDRRFANDPDIIHLLNNYINRVNAMLQIQRYLLESNVKTGTVQLDLYLSNLIDSINQALNKEDTSVVINEQMETILLDYDLTLRLGLVMNEVISNSFEHGFNGIEEPKLDILLTEDNTRINLTIIDNGIGIENLEEFRTSSKGIGLIEMIIKNEKGSISFDSKSNEGTTVKIVIPNKKGHPKTTLKHSTTF